MTRNSLWRLILGVSLLLSSYAISLVALSGRIGFWDDGWWVFGFAYRYRWLNAMYSFADNLHRPIEGVYWTTLYELWDANSLAFHLASLLLYAVACGLMGLSLGYLLPHRLRFAVLATIFAFFLPAVAGTTYIMQTDNGRLQMAFFWASILSLLIWVKRGQRWGWFVLTFGLYSLATLTYESGVLLVFTLPMWVWVMWDQLPAEQRRLSGRQLLFWVLGGMLVSFVAFVVARFTVFDGGAVPQRTLIPPPYYYWDYTIKALDSFRVAAEQGLSDSPSLALGMGMAGGVWALWGWFIPSTKPFTTHEERGVILLSGAIFILGGIPYFLAGYNYIIAPDFISATRLYSSGGYGLAMLLAWLLTRWDAPSLQQVSRVVAVIAVAIFASYHAQQRLAWQGADQMRESIWQSLVTQVPEVSPQTVMVLIDFKAYYEFAPVIEVDNGVNNYMQMLYDDVTVSGHLVYLDNIALYDKGHFVTISPAGIELPLRGYVPAPFDQVILVKREGDEVVILDRITADDLLNGAPLATYWEGGATEITSNLDLIQPATPADQARQQALIEG